MTTNFTQSLTANAPDAPDAKRRATMRLERSMPEYRRAGVALFLAGFASFSLMYCVQPLLPAFTQSFAISPAESSLSLSLTTGLLAISIVMASAFSQFLGRRSLMLGSMILAAVCNVAAAIAPSWHGVLVARALEGIALGGVPAIAMAYISEEIDPKDLGKAMGVYIGGTAFGAMMGRVGMGLLTEITTWRVAMTILGIVCLACAVGFACLLPRSRNFTPGGGISWRGHLRAWSIHLRNTALLRLYGIGFVLTGIFATLFNYSTFRLAEAPYQLSQTEISLVFLVFGFGIVASPIAGSLIERFGRKRLLLAGFVAMLAGILVSLASSLLLVVGGTILVTIGFFVCHSVASSSVGAAADGSKAHASGLYLLYYYLGASISGTLAGWFWQEAGWPAIVAFGAALAVAGLALSLGSIRKPQ